jgi:hypothetical protein
LRNVRLFDILTLLLAGGLLVDRETTPPVTVCLTVADT